MFVIWRAFPSEGNSHFPRVRNARPVRNVGPAWPVGLLVRCDCHRFARACMLTGQRAGKALQEISLKQKKTAQKKAVQSVNSLAIFIYDIDISMIDTHLSD